MSKRDKPKRAAVPPIATLQPLHPIHLAQVRGGGDGLLVVEKRTEVKDAHDRGSTAR